MVQDARLVMCPASLVGQRHGKHENQWQLLLQDGVFPKWTSFIRLKCQVRIPIHVKIAHKIFLQKPLLVSKDFLAPENYRC